MIRGADVGLERFRANSARRLSRVGAVFKAALRPDDPGVLRRKLEETSDSLPYFAAINLFLSFGVWHALQPLRPGDEVLAWCLANVLLSLAIIFSAVSIRDKFRVEANGRRFAAVAPFIAMVQLTLWAWAILVMGAGAPEATRSELDLMGATIAFSGLLCTWRLPGAALQFAVAAGVCCYMRILWSAGRFEVQPFLVAALSVVGVSAQVLALAAGFRRRVALERDAKVHGEVVRLLLHEFEGDLRDWMWETDAQGRLAYHSPKLASLLGKAGEDLRGIDLNAAVFEQFAPGVCAVLKAMQPCQDLPMTTRFGSGVMHWQVTARPIFEREKIFAGYRGVARDVTKQREQELSIDEARAAAEKAHDAKAQFLAVMSHELRTPINSIVGFSEVLSAGQAENLPVSARKEYLGTILESAKHLQGLINDVLEATRLERGAVKLDQQPVDAAELVEISVKIMGDQASKSHISISAHLIEGVEITADVTRCKQVLLNLLTNAIKFSPEGSLVHVDMARTADGGLAISVRDAGIGISDDDVERIFEPFVQAENGANRRFGGMGLGLAIARRFARLHGGDLALKGQIGMGTQATFTLPAYRVRWPKARQRTAAPVPA